MTIVYLSMNRFKLLTIGLFGLVLLGAGCTVGTGGVTVAEMDPDAEVSAGGIYTEVQRAEGDKTILRPSDIHLSGQTTDTFPVLNEATFVSVEEALAEGDGYLYDDLYGYAVETENGSQFYPTQILAWHGVLHDVIDGQDVAVLYSPLTDVGGVFLRPDGARFEVGGYVWNNDTLFLDSRTQSLWSTLLRQAVYGPSAGEALEPIPFVGVSWATWREANPDGRVLSSNTGYTRSYEVSSYGRYLVTNDTIFDLSSEFIPALLPKAVVSGLQVNGQAKAYQEGPLIQRAGGIVNDRVGEQDVVIWADTTRALRAHVRPEGAEFDLQGNGLVDQDGIVWFLTDAGELTDGVETLASIPLINTFWFAWQASYPDTHLYANVNGKGFVDGAFNLEEGEGESLEDDPGVEINASFDGATPEINVDAL